MAKDSKDDLTQNNSQDNDIEPTDGNPELTDDNPELNDSNAELTDENPEPNDIESSDSDIESTDITEQTDTEDNDTPTDTEADIGKFERPQTHKLAQNNMPLIFITLAALGVIVIGYFWISNKKGKKNNTNSDVPFEQTKPNTANIIPVPTLQKSSSRVPTGAAAIAPPTPKKKSPIKPAVPTIPTLLLPDHTKESNTSITTTTKKIPHSRFEKNNRHVIKRKSSIMLMNSSTQSSDTQSSKETQKTGLTVDSNTADGNFNPKVTKASTTKLSKIGNMSTTITQGKILDAVLETPINTLYPGPIRALISRDVYSEKGNNVLIPKGSRIIGILKGGYTAGQTRVGVNWIRILLPTGYDIEITSAPAVGKLGMMGLEGIVNRQFIETIGNAALLSIINIGAAKIMEEQFNIGSNTSISSTNSSGTVTTTSSQTPTQQAAEKAVDNLSNITKNWLSKNFLVTPYIVINQGTRVKVFVNQDIRFPKNINSSGFIK